MEVDTIGFSWHYDITFCHLPMDPSDKEDEVAIDLGTVYKLVNVAGIHCLS